MDRRIGRCGASRLINRLTDGSVMQVQHDSHHIAGLDTVAICLRYGIMVFQVLWKYEYITHLFLCAFSDECNLECGYYASV